MAIQITRHEAPDRRHKAPDATNTEKRDNTEETIIVVAMLQTFKAILKGNVIEWIDEAPQLGDHSIAVHITVLEEDLGSDAASRGQRMAEVLEKLAANRAFSEVDPVTWQREVRCDRSILGRDE